MENIESRLIFGGILSANLNQYCVYAQNRISSQQDLISSGLSRHNYEQLSASNNKDLLSSYFYIIWAQVHFHCEPCTLLLKRSQIKQRSVMLKFPLKNIQHLLFTELIDKCCGRTGLQQPAAGFEAEINFPCEFEVVMLEDGEIIAKILFEVEVMLLRARLHSIYNKLIQMRSREKLTNIDKRKLTYDRTANNNSNPDRPANPLDLPLQFQNKISQTEYKKLKEAFFIEADKQFKINKKKFPVVMRSIGIVLNTGEFHKIFDELQDRYMTWKQFLQAYIAKRGCKGSYNQLSHAVYALSKQYRGDWEELLKDLQTLGDVLSKEELQIFKKDILKGKTLTTETLINSLLYQK